MRLPLQQEATTGQREHRENQRRAVLFGMLAHHRANIILTSLTGPVFAD